MNGKTGQKPNGKAGQCEHWNRLPDSVLHDKGLSLAAKCVYAELAGTVHQGNVATLGQRRIASRIGIHQETVGKALKELAGRNHVVTAAFGKQRHCYVLLSNVFGSKQRAGVEELVSAPNGHRRLVTVRSA